MIAYADDFIVTASSEQLLHVEIIPTLEAAFMYRKHPNKGRGWIIQKHFTTVGSNHWRFHCIVKDKLGNKKPLYLKQAKNTLIQRHKKIKARATPFNPCYMEYFKQRFMEKKSRTMRANNSKSAGLRIIQLYANLSGVR